MSSAAEYLPAGVRIAQERVYHYTGAVALLGMIRDRKLWASEAAGMNDRAEVRQGWAKILDWAEKQPDSPAIEVIRTHARSPELQPHEIFVLSASTRPDDANQWRLYADGGRGYAVELDVSVPLAVVSDARASLTHREPADAAAVEELDLETFFDPGLLFARVTPWLHVLYTEEEINTALQLLARKLDADGARFDDMRAQRVDEQEVQDHAAFSYRSSFEDVALLANLIKEPGFEGENEVRIVTTFDRSEDHLKYRAGTYGVVGYAELASSPHGDNSYIGDGEELAPLPIKSVRIGPLLAPEHDRTLVAMLRKFGQAEGVDVDFSGVPLR
ncbi:DUF2971 domain-containing protein [Pimelobacter sp. 30-1]|uniref:DUF2971 domain-containing protein n=1 Tax=Pimelobacter sp. 30-1 TaxID=2004991 RepID=UPI001C0438CD|nr:DUF2971 domain-containing protein [Pimelobacter sp. 30-1]MBU2698802.1 hypothetical protein [Pimelobacter sp. 30-1]